MKRKANGQFLRVHKKWSLSNFNDGYADAKNRFRVYLPTHARADKKEGYILRAIAVWEKHHNKKASKKYVIHHKNKNTLDDSKENLELVSVSEHQKIHRGNYIKRVCNFRKKDFLINAWRLKDKSRGKYCSQKCCKLKRAGGGVP